MALDTGATYTLISPEAARSLGYALNRRSKTVPITTPSRTETVPLVRVRAIQCMGRQLRNVDVICHTLPKKATVEGLLGLNFLNKFNLSLFFKDHFLEIR
ncbi:MAG: retropepsin-like domain-containing protein [Deltaproteobacteria bacterium]|nr:retropepsin-like domain-containing protein [Deltaproteobacteria bacterium]